MNVTLRMLALATLFAAGSAITTAQNLPDSPAPAPLPDPAWSGLQNLSIGRPIIVTDVRGRSVHCLFAGVTDAYLFCNPAGNPPGAGFRFDHADVIGVDLDLPHLQQIAHSPRGDRNYHPAWISCMIAGGIIVGLVASQNTTVGKAAEDGAIGAGIVGLIGAPMAFLPRPQPALATPAAGPFVFGAQLSLPIRLLFRK